MDTIQIQNIRAYGYTGVLPEEQVLGQWFEVNLRLGVDLLQAGHSDQLEHTLNYCEAIALVKQIITTEKFALIERLAQVIADRLLTLDKVVFVQIQLLKQPPIPDFGGQVIIEMTRHRTN